MLQTLTHIPRPFFKKKAVGALRLCNTRNKKIKKGRWMAIKSK